MDKKEETKKRLQEYIESGNSISYKDMEKEDSSLLYAIYRYLGNIQKACNSIGIKDEVLASKFNFHIEVKDITEEEVISRLELLDSIGEVKTKNLKRDGGYFKDSKLFSVLKNNFSSIDEGLSHYGYVNQYKVNHKNIRDRLEEHLSKDGDMSFRYMSENDLKLVNDIRNRFSSYYEGLDYYQTPYKRAYNVISEENIVKRIKTVIENNGTVNYTILKKEDPSVLHYSYKVFDSFDNMLKELGFDEYITEHPSTLIRKGREFESIFKEILETLDVEHLYNKTINDVRPDFRLTNNVWIDTKLSTWTPSIQETIDKYSPECDKLLIVYLRGETDIINYYNIPKNTKIVSVYSLTKSLPEDKRNKIINRLQSIEENILNTVRND